MLTQKRALRLALAAVLFAGALGCSVANVTDMFIAQATATATRTPRPTFTPLPKATDTPIPTNTVPPLPTPTRTLTPRPTTRPATARPPTPRPVAQPTAPPQPTVSPFEFHANVLSCVHSGMTYLKGTVYNDKNDPNNRYAGAIVALGPPDGSTIYAVEKTGDDGVYTHVLGGPGEAKPGNWGLWLVDPTMKRKSDIGGPIATNNLPADNPSSCWAGGVDFWK